jgi:hypothetical protein
MYAGGGTVDVTGGVVTGGVGAAERGVEVARNQGNNVIAEALQANAELYRTRLPLRTGLR